MLAVELENVSKRYSVRPGTTAYRTLREALSSRLAGWRRRAPESPREIWALRDVDCRVTEGEVVGIIGRNGAGKTTLLKIVGNITPPTNGVARVRGRVGSLLDVGTGFHPELTGRENVFLSGAVLGMTKSDIRQRFEEIVTFAGVERFLDTPLKRYSSGMRLRLAFSVAAHLESEVVVVDEVLAQGDLEFQQRCVGRLGTFGSEGRTVLFVSHDLGAVASLCSRTVWIDRGSIMEDGPTAQTIDRYLASASPSATTVDFGKPDDGDVQILSAELFGPKGRILDGLRRDQSFSIRVRVRVRERTPGLDFAFFLLNQRGAHVLAEAWSDGRAPDSAAGEAGVYDVIMTVPAILAPGRYTVRVWVGTAHGDLLDRDLLTFNLLPRRGETNAELERARIVAPQVEWLVREVGERGQSTA
jgi:ABC-type polysaccharide/polyol phosphate transport system ATPase subunit